MKWAQWIGDDDNRIHEPGGFLVSTIFLGIDLHFYHDDGGPWIFWETIIVGGPNEGFQQGYSSRADAEAGHTAAVIMARSGIQ